MKQKIETTYEIKFIRNLSFIHFQCNANELSENKCVDIDIRGISVLQYPTNK